MCFSSFSLFRVQNTSGVSATAVGPSQDTHQSSTAGSAAADTYEHQTTIHKSNRSNRASTNQRNSFLGIIFKCSSKEAPITQV